jgi:hypothetical protein
MSPAVDVVERPVIQRKLRHGAHPVLQWCAANAVVTRDPRAFGLVEFATACELSSRVCQGARRIARQFCSKRDERLP